MILGSTGMKLMWINLPKGKTSDWNMVKFRPKRMLQIMTVKQQGK